MTASREEIEQALRRARTLAAKASRAAHRWLAEVNASGRPGRIMRAPRVALESALLHAARERALAAMLREGAT